MANAGDSTNPRIVTCPYCTHHNSATQYCEWCMDKKLVCITPVDSEYDKVCRVVGD